MNHKTERTVELIKKLAAEFMARESSGGALITITSVTLSDNKQRATVFFTVFPVEKEKALYDFAKRKRPEFRDYLGKHSRIGKLPFIDFEVDRGEKHRQRIDELSQEANSL